MRHGRRMTAAFIAAALAAGTLSLTGCHGAKITGKFEVPAELDTKRERTVTFWAKNDTNKAQTDVYNQAIRDFEALYPSIHVRMKLYTDYGRIYNDVITNIPTGTTPDVCITYPDHIATYLTGTNVVVPLDELMEDPSYGLGGSDLLFDGAKKDEIIRAFLNECRLDGACYALPFMRSTEACYVNQTYVEKLGFTLPETLTWDFVWKVSEAAMEKNRDGTYKVNGQKVMIPFLYKSTDNMMIQMLRQKGAGYSTDEGKVELFNGTTEDLLMRIGKYAKSGVFSTFKVSGYPANFLNAGQCIFAVDSTAGSTWMGSGAPLMDIASDKVVRFQTAVRSVPQYDPDKPQMISQGPSICLFNHSDPQDVLAGWLFAQFLLTDKVQIAYAKTEGYVPVTEGARASRAYQTYLKEAGQDGKEHYAVKMEATKLLLEHTDDTFTTPVFNGSASLRDAAGQTIEEVTKAARRRTKISRSFVKSVFGKVKKLDHLDQIRETDEREEKQDLGPMPAASKALLCTLAAVWMLLIGFWIAERHRTRRVGK